MPDQQSNAVKQPLQPQLDLENWCRSVGGDRATREGWEKGASGVLAQRLATLYLKKVLEIYAASKHSPGRQRHVWDLMHDVNAVKHVALEAFTYVIGNLNEDRSFNQICLAIGRRAEYILWLKHPTWGKSLHLEGLKLASNNNLSMSLIKRRLKDAGFRKAAAYRELTHAERAALGAFFVECIAESTHMIEIYIQTSFKRRKKMIRYADIYWKFLAQWREAAVMFRPLYLPMLVEPRPWTTHSNGGYLTIRTAISSVGWERWPEVSKRALPCVVNSINLLQSQAMAIDHEQADLVESCWNLGHSVGGLPRRDRMAEPVDNDFKKAGLGPSAYWKAVWKWKGDRRQDSARSRLVNGLVSYRRMQEADTCFHVWHMDHRGRLYARGAQLNPQGPDHFRSMLQFKEQSPIKGYEKAFAWSVGEAMGLPANRVDRVGYLELMSTVIGRVGSDPLSHINYWEQAKEPFRFIQLCRDWHSYLKDPTYTSGTIHWLDQTCSGWGHVACLTRDGTLAQYTNIVGDRSADLYEGVGRLVMARVRWRSEQGGNSERDQKCFDWWRQHKVPRLLWKNTLMPVIYGRSYKSLSEAVKLYLREEIEDFLTEDGLRVLDLALVLATTINDVVKEALPNVRDLSKWLTKISNMQIDSGLRPYWFTANGLAVESYASETKTDCIELCLSRRTIKVALRDATGCKPDKLKTARKLVPDYIHSMDAAYLQRFVAHWGTYKHPISTVHDCFGTTLEHVDTMQSELNDQWHRFYSVDHLTKHQGMVAALLGKEIPAPPIIGTLDQQRIGENPYLFG